MAGHYPGVRVQMWLCLICVIPTYSNGAVQTRVGLELSGCEPADTLQSPKMGNLGNTIFGTQKGTSGGPLLEPFK